MVQGLVLKMLEVKAKKEARWEAVSRKVTNSDEAQREKTAEPEKRVEIFDGQSVVPKTVSRRSKSRRREEGRNGRENSGKTSSQKVRRPKVQTLWKVQSVSAAESIEQKDCSD